MKILFFYPNDYLSKGIPQGIAILSACLKLAGHETDIFDLTFLKTKDYKSCVDNNIYLPTEYTLEDLVKIDPVVDLPSEFIKKLEQVKPDLIAMSAMSSSFDVGLQLLNSVKKYIHCPVVVGGVHATIDTKDALNAEIIDYAIIGEGEEALIELVDAISNKLDTSNIKNLAWKDGNEIFINPLRPFVNLDSLPCPDWSIFDKRHLFQAFVGKIYSGSFYGMSRGCPYRCTYCVNSTLRDVQISCGTYFRIQSVQKTISDLKQLKEQFGITWIKFEDDSIMSFKIECLKKLHDGFKPLNIIFGCSVRPESTTNEKLGLLRDMGCVAMSVGIESGNEELRYSQLNRKMTNHSIENAVKSMQNYGIRVSTFNMLGLPNETRDNVFETIRLNKKLNVSSCNVYVVFPYPGTPLSVMAHTNYRDGEGNIIPVSKASHYHLSQMNPEEVDGLYKTFNLYVDLPEELWPIVTLAEGENNIGKMIRKTLRDYVTNYIL